MADTRARIVSTVRDLFAEKGFHAVSIDEVSHGADVARATVYHQFGSKLGLLEAVLVDFERRAGLHHLGELVTGTPVDQLVRTVITEGCRYWATDPVLARKILAVGTTDAGAGDLLARHDAGRLRLLTVVVGRLVEAGLIRASSSPQQALDALWLLTSFDAYDQLSRGRGRSLAETADALSDLAERAVVRRRPGRRRQSAR